MISRQPYISVIICTYNRDKYIYDSLSLVAQNDISCNEYEIILINNKSTDNTEEECNRFKINFPEINFKYFIELQQGLSFARNRGVTEACGDILVFLDDDSFVKKDYIKNLKHSIEQYPDMAAFGGKIIPFFESGEKPKWLCKWTYSWVSAINLGEKTCEFSGKKYPIGANMGFRKICLEKYGSFNTQLGRNKKNLMAGEEKDLFFRLITDKQKIYYFPNIEVEHIIPPNRTTKQYIIKMAQGVGLSEKIRCLELGKKTLYLRYFSELIKWLASIVLWCFYCIQGNLCTANMIVLFRFNVTKFLMF